MHCLEVYFLNFKDVTKISLEMESLKTPTPVGEFVLWVAGGLSIVAPTLLLEHSATHRTSPSLARTWRPTLATMTSGWPARVVAKIRTI